MSGKLNQRRPSKPSSKDIRRDNVRNKALNFNGALGELFEELYRRLLGLEDQHYGISQILKVLKGDGRYAIEKIEPLISLAKKFEGLSSNDYTYHFYKDLANIRILKGGEERFLSDLQQIIDDLPVSQNTNTVDEPFAYVIRSGNNEHSIKETLVKPVSAQPSEGLLHEPTSAPSDRLASPSSIEATVDKLRAAIQEISFTTNSSGMRDIASELKKQGQSTQVLFEGLISVAKERLGQGDNAPKSVFEKAALRFRAANRDSKIDALYQCLARMDASRISDQDVAELNQRIRELPVPPKAKAQSSGILSALAREFSVLADGLGGGLGLFGAPAAKTMSRQEHRDSGLKTRF